MTQWRLFSNGASVGLTDGTSGFATFYGGASTYFASDEAANQFKAYVGYTFSDIRANITTNNATGASIPVSDDGTASSNVVISTTATGWAEDVTGSETVAANSLIAADLTNLGMHGDSIAVSDVMITYEHASTNAPLFMSSASSTISATQYFAPASGSDTTTEAEAQQTAKRAVTLSNIRFYVNNGTSPTGSAAIRINGSTSSNLAASVTAAGAVEDTTGTDSVTASDLFNFGLIYTSGSFVIQQLIQVQGDTAESILGSGDSASSFTTREIAPFNGEASATSTDVSNYTSHEGSVSAGNLQAYVTSAGSGTRDVSFRINTTDSSNLTVSITGTGLVEDTTGSDSVGDTDGVGWSGASTGTTVSVQRVSVEQPWSSIGPVVTQPYYVRTGGTPGMRIGRPGAIFGRSW